MLLEGLLLKLRIPSVRAIPPLIVEVVVSAHPDAHLRMGRDDTVTVDRKYGQEFNKFKIF
jgi:hypothetical protein